MDLRRKIQGMITPAILQASEAAYRADNLILRLGGRHGFEILEGIR